MEGWRALFVFILILLFIEFIGFSQVSILGDVFFRSDRLNETLMIYMAEFTAIRAGGVVTLMGFFRIKLVFC